MDNLTHSLIGYMLSRSGLDRLHPRATLILVLAANAPDIDGVSWFAGPITYLDTHRGWTHSVVMLPLFALFPWLVAKLFTRRGPFPWVRGWILAMIGVASHLFLDWTNVYGVRLLSPFSQHWYRADLTSLYDFWIWMALFICIVAPWLGRLVSGEIGAKQSKGRGFAIAGLLLFFAIDGGRAFLHERTIEIMSSRIYEGGTVVRYAAWPNPANPFRWRGYVETPVSHRVYDINVLGDFDPTLGRVFYKPDPSAALDAARTDAQVRGLLRFSQFPMWRLLPGEREDTTRVDLMDLRFGTPPPPHFAVSALIDSASRVVDSKFSF